MQHDNQCKSGADWCDEGESWTLYGKRRFSHLRKRKLWVASYFVALFLCCVCAVMKKHIFFTFDAVLGLWSHCDTNTEPCFKGINKQNCWWVEGIDEDTNILRVVACSRWLHFHVGIAGAMEERHAACGQSSPRSSCRRQSVFLFFFLSVIVKTEGKKKPYTAVCKAFFFLQVGDAERGKRDSNS